MRTSRRYQALWVHDCVWSCNADECERVLGPYLNDAEALRAAAAHWVTHHGSNTGGVPLQVRLGTTVCTTCNASPMTQTHSGLCGACAYARIRARRDAA